MTLIKSSTYSNDKLIHHFLHALSAASFSSHTLSAYKRDLHVFIKWLEKNKPEASLLTLDQTSISTWLDDQNQQVTTSTLNRRLASLRKFYEWAAIHTDLKNNPLQTVKNNKISRANTEPLTTQEIEALLAAPDTTSMIELRDKCMLEIMYATGLRVSELIDLQLQQLDLTQGLLLITHPNPQRHDQRLIPLGTDAYDWLQRYLQHSRPHLLGDKQSADLFVSTHGKAMTRQSFWLIIKKYTERAKITSAISPQRLRQAFASHLLNNGADVKMVQLLLGHKNASTTHIYSQITRERLKKLHAEHHPRA